MKLIWIDWVLISFLGLSGLISIWRGLLRESLSCLFFIFVMVIYWLFTDILANILQNIISNVNIQYIVAIILIFMLTSLIGMLFRLIVNKIVDNTPPAFFSRTIAIPFGIFRGVVLLTIFTGILMYIPKQYFGAWWNTKIIMHLQNIVFWSNNLVNEYFVPLLHLK